MSETPAISDDPVIPFRVSHATMLATIKTRMDDFSTWGKIGVGGSITLLAAILGALLMHH